MRNLQFVTLLLLAAISVGPSFTDSNSRSLASEDCISCDDPSSSNSANIEKNIKNLNKSIPALTDNQKIFFDLKGKHVCGENDYASRTKSKGRLSKDEKYFVQNDPMYSEVDDAQFIFGMNLPKKGELKSSKSVKPYIGKTFQNDLLMIEEVFSGRKVIGYNVTISYCSAAANDKDLVHDDRELRDLAFGGINLDSDNTCGLFNDIDSARVSVVSKSKGFFGRDIPFESVFTALDCDL